MADRYQWLHRIERLDPVADHEEIYRYDDTALLLAEIAANGYDSPRGKESLRVINRVHGQCRICNDDMRYVLTAFGLPAAPRWVTGAIHGALRARAVAERWLLPARRGSRLAVEPKNRTYPGYPGGLTPADLGAPPPPDDLDPRWLAK